MILINHEKQIIFIRIPKTASTYLTKMLINKYNFIRCLDLREDHDIIFNTNKLDNDKFWGGKEMSFFDYFKTSTLHNEILKMDEIKWNTYSKVCFVRNPYDRIVSGWKFIKERHQQFDSFNYIHFSSCDFKDYLKLDPNSVSVFEFIHTFMTQTFNIIKYDVKYIGKLENIEKEFIKILIDTGLEINESNIVFEKTKINSTSHDNYKKYYDNESIALVNKIFEEDFINFGYTMVSSIEELLKLD
jgi:hypothetical protein